MSDYIDTVELNNNWVKIIQNDKLNSLKLKYHQYPLPINLNPSHLLLHNNNLIAIDSINGLFKFKYSRSNTSYNTNQPWSKISDIPMDFPEEKEGDWSTIISANNLYISMIEPWHDDEGSTSLPLSDDNIANIATFNLITKQWKYDLNSWDKSEEAIEFEGPLSMINIADKLHIIDTAKGSHSIFNEHTQLLKTLNDTKPFRFIQKWDNIIYIPFINKLYSIGYHHNKIHFAHVLGQEHIHDFKDLEWKQHKISIPSETIPVLISERLLLFWPIGWETMDRSVWIMDVKNDKIYKSDKILPDVTMNKLIKTEDDYLIGIDELNNNLIQISLFDLLPHQLFDLNTARIDKLVAGFVRFIDFNNDQLYQNDRIHNDQLDNRYQCVNNKNHHSSSYYLYYRFNLPLHTSTNTIYRRIPQDLLHIVRDFVLFIL